MEGRWPNYINIAALNGSRKCNLAETLITLTTGEDE